MKRAILVAASILAFASSVAWAEDQRPSWITDAQIAELGRIGIDPSSDLEARGNYHWRWRSHKNLAIGDYRCPAGSAVDISRNLFQIVAEKGAACRDAKGGRFGFVKIWPDGSMEGSLEGD